MKQEKPPVGLVVWLALFALFIALVILRLGRDAP